ETVTSESYCDLLQNHLPALLEDVPLHIRKEMWFQQDGAPPHFAIITIAIIRQFLNEKFGNKWIGRKGPRQCPPQSPDLTPLDFFLWGYVK
ncbi:hypothetical protein EAG_02386, partial [Camponotus floridanus]